MLYLSSVKVIDPATYGILLLEVFNLVGIVLIDIEEPFPVFSCSIGFYCPCMYM